MFMNFMKADKEPTGLTSERIQFLARGIKVRAIAVENFLFSLNKGTKKVDAEMNLYMDARSYGWNVETQRAIKQGIEEYFRNI